MDKNEFKESRSFKSNIGFYIALTICILTIAAAAWNTYGSVVEYNSQVNTSQPSQEVRANNDVSGQKYESSVIQQSSKIFSEVSRKEYSVVESSITESAEPSVESVSKVTEEMTVQPPVDNGRVIKKFSPENPVKSATTSDWRTHQGLDISAKAGSEVHSARNGIVRSVYKDTALGNVVCIEHTGGYTAYYCGLGDEIDVDEGNAVNTGDILGYVGTVPLEVLDESHIHIEVRKNGEYIDPSILFAK